MLKGLTLIFGLVGCLIACSGEEFKGASSAKEPVVSDAGGTGRAGDNDTNQGPNKLNAEDILGQAATDSDTAIAEGGVKRFDFDNLQESASNAGGDQAQTQAGTNGTGPGSTTNQPSEPIELSQKDPNNFIIDFGCKADGQKVFPTFSGGKDTLIAIEGEYCPDQSAFDFSLNVTFVIDRSGSMDRHDNDCKRFDAMASMVDKLKSTKKTTDQVNVSVVNFNGDAEIILTATDINLFDPVSVKSEVCSDSGSTNYEDALLKAQEALGADAKRKVVYFISDGLPTESNSSSNDDKAREAGIMQATALRNAGATLYSLFLAPGGNDVDEAANYIVQMTGNKQNVRLVTDAEQLLKGILEFDNPVENLTVQDIQAQLKNVSLPTRPFELASLNKISEARWKFVTKPVKPIGRVGEAVENQIHVQINADIDGQTTIFRTFYFELQ